MQVTHVITTLATAGAQTALYRLVTASRGQDLHHAVVSLTDEGTFGPRLRADGVPVTCLGMRPGRPDPVALARLVRLLRRERPDVVQGWMYHANLLAAFAAAPLRIPVIWGIRHADVDPRHTKRMTQWTNALCARLSGILPARVVCCADAARRSHESVGYRPDRMMVIPNGFDVARLTENPAAGAEVRAELAIPGDAPVVGMLARLHPDKGHETLLAAARHVVDRRPDVVFLLAGDDVEWSNPAIAGPVDALGLRDRFRLLGARGDVPALLSAMDVLASPSRTEAFSQVLGEAMSCGVPCAVTDCGDSAEIVGPTGRVAPVGDGPALGAAILELLALDPAVRVALGAAARARVCERYDLRQVVRRWADLYAELVQAPGALAA
jgi:glycosyltransferase involved in cell wall biosynthesis